MVFKITELCNTCTDTSCPEKTEDAVLECPADISERFQHLRCDGDPPYIVKNYQIPRLGKTAAARIRSLMPTCILCRRIISDCTGCTRAEWDVVAGRGDVDLSCFEH